MHVFWLKLSVLAVVLLAVTDPTEVTAQESHEQVEHDFHRNVFAVFLGATLEDGSRERSIGFEYERRLNENFGVGVTAERTAGERFTWIYVASLAYHAGPWKLYFAPGVEDSEDGDESLWRLGAEYGFEVGEWEIAPQIDVDFIDNDELLVLGVTFGKGF